MKLNTTWEQILDELFDLYYNDVIDKKEFFKRAYESDIEYQYIEEYFNDVDNPIW